MPVQHVAVGGRSVYICLDAVIAIMPDGVYTDMPKLTLCNPTRETKLEGDDRRLLLQVSWSRPFFISSVARIASVAFTNEQSRDVVFTICKPMPKDELVTVMGPLHCLARVMRRIMKQEKQLACVMAAHPRLGEKSPLASLHEVVGIIAKLI
jgi:hypothetical protein